jgi:hypothetical protein
VPHQVDPAAPWHHVFQPIGLDRRVADDLQELLVRPDIVFQRRDVEVADEDRGHAGSAPEWMALHLLDEIELVGEFRIDRRVGLVAAGRHIEIVQADRLAAGDRSNSTETWRAWPTSPGVALVDLLERQARDDGDAVIALLAVDRDVFR